MMLKKFPLSLSPPKALMTVGKEPFPTIYVDSQKENEVRMNQKLYTGFYFLKKFSSEHRGL